MRNRTYRDDDLPANRVKAVAGIVSRHPRESVATFAGMAAVMAIFVNALFLQHGPHPAPIFATAPARAPAPAPVAVPTMVPPLPQALVRSTAPPVAPAPEPAARTRAQIVTDIQRELSRRGFYDGAVDGVWGAQTDAASRSFADAAGLKVNIEASEDLIRAIAASKTKAGAKPAAGKDVPRTDPIAELLAPAKRVVAVQRVLAEYGFGQIKPTGTLNPETQDAIEKFERGHKMPVTGQISDQLVRALAAMTGRPID